MRKIRGSLFVSLDGVMQAPGGPTEDPTGGFAHGGWLPQFFDEEVGAAIDAFFGTEYSLLLGRRTYDIFAAYWPYVGGDATGVGEVFDATGKDYGEAGAIAMGQAYAKADKYVLSRGNPDLGWSNSHKLGSIEEVAELKQGEGPDLLIQGSSTLYPALIAEGLLDRLTLMTFPVVVGSGKRWLDSATSAVAMRLVEEQRTASGALIATYEHVGTISQGWAGPQSSSTRERARQQAMAEGRW
jgi:dihydrofolate reductase